MPGTYAPRPEPISLETRARWAEERTACAHVRVSVRRREESPGYVTAEWWECDSGCGAKFAPMAALAEAERARDELRAEVREWLCEQCHVVYPGPPQKGFACVVCPRCGGSTGPRTLVERRQAEARLAEVARSMVGHFQREHLEGDGPEIDRWKARLRAAVEALVEATKFFDKAYVGEDGLGTPLVPTSEEVEWRMRADAALRAARGGGAP